MFAYYSWEIREVYVHLFSYHCGYVNPHNDVNYWSLVMLKASDDEMSRRAALVGGGGTGITE